MSNETTDPTKKPDDPAKAAQPAKPPAPQGTPGEHKRAKSVAEAKPVLDERKLKYQELLGHASLLDADELVGMLIDGRAVVRANAALGLAACNQALPQLVPLLRDSEAMVGTAAAEALTRLGPLVRPLVPAIALATDGTRPEVTEVVVELLAELVGKADEDLAVALDSPLEVAAKGVLAACGKAGKRGIATLVHATRHERSRIRVNAVAGLGLYGKIDADTAMACLTQIEATDPVPDIRTAAKQSMLAVVAREKQVVVDSLPKNVPDFEARKLSASELAEYAEVIDIDQMIFALQDGRDHVRINASRALAAKGGRSGRAAAQMGLLMRDSAAGVRREAAKALGKLGAEGLPAAGDLVGGLGDKEADVAEAAAETLSALGEAAMEALVKGLEAGEELHGQRVGELIAKSPRASALLVEAFKSPAVNVQVNAAHGLGLLGIDRVGAGLEALKGARTGGDARTRDAVRKAIDMIEAHIDTGPKAVAVDGFEDRFLSAAEIEKKKAEVERVGVDDLAHYLQDGRDVVRGNAASALGVIGKAAAVAARSLGVLLRDDAARVRLAAAHALDKIGDQAVYDTADDLVGALGDSDAKVADACAAVVRARKARMIGALVRGLETDKPDHGRRICEVINVLPDAQEILCDAFESPAVNVQVNAALGLGMLGPERVGKGRKALEGARTGGWERTRDAVRKAIDTLDGPKKTGPDAVAVDGFETRLLGAEAFADPTKLRLDELAAYLPDGRAIVRANAATALGALGPAAAGVALAMAVLLRDDDTQVRIAAARALDKLGDDVVREIAEFLVGALKGDADAAKASAHVLGPRKAKVLTALLKGLHTDDETQARRILELVNALPDACEILCDAFASPAENVQVNAAIGIGMLGAKRAGSAGKKVLEGARTGGFARTREAVFKGLALLKELP